MAWRKRSTSLKTLAEGLVKVGALQFGTFTLPGGEETSYYINLRGLPSYPGVFKEVVGAIGGLLEAKVPKADAICGIPTTGLTIGSAVALNANKPLVYTRTTKAAGDKVVEGEVRPDWNVVVLDDLVESGKTILSAARAVEQEGGLVKHAVVLIDRQEGGREALSREGIALHSVTDVVELADTLHSMELISDTDMKAITKSVGRRRQ